MSTQPLISILYLTNDYTSLFARGLAQILNNLDQAGFRIIIISLRSPQSRVRYLLFQSIYLTNNRAIQGVYRRAPPHQISGLSKLLRQLSIHGFKSIELANYLMRAGNGYLFIEPFMRGDSIYNFNIQLRNDLWQLVHNHCLRTKEPTVPIIIADLPIQTTDQTIFSTIPAGSPESKIKFKKYTICTLSHEIRHLSNSRLHRKLLKNTTHEIIFL